MEKLNVMEILNPMAGKLIQGKGETLVQGVSIDSRRIDEGDLFFAIVGPNHNAHKFLQGAYDNGCRAVVISQREAAEDLPRDCCIILVEDTLVALQELAKWYVGRMDMRKIAVTGSVGKTTTRDMIFACLSRKYNTGTCRHNFNNQVGLPLAMLELRDNMQVAVLEMAMEEPNHIRRLAELVKPDVAVITNIGISHIEKLGSRENIFKEKMEVVHFFGEENVLVINGDDDMLATLNPEEVSYRIVKAGSNEAADFSASDVEDLGASGVRFNLNCNQGCFPIRLSVPGAHNAVNATMAAAACSVMGVAIEDIIAGLGQVEMTDNRLKLSTVGEICIINDTYNAAPESMKSALVTLTKSEGKRKIAILGAMNELGDMSKEAHLEVGRFAARQGVDMLITIGEQGALITEGASEVGGVGTLKHFDTKEKLMEEIKSIFQPGDVVMLKASRTVELEKVAEKMEEELAE